MKEGKVKNLSLKAKKGAKAGMRGIFQQLGLNLRRKDTTAFRKIVYFCRQIDLSGYGYCKDD